MQFLIEGAPIPCPRPRFSKQGSHVYNPKAKELSDLSFEIQQQALSKEYKFLPSNGPISMSITFFMPIPKGNSQKRINELKGKPYTLRTGDIDNLIKQILDAMNGVVFKDDSQVYCVDATKLYSENPHTQISIIDVNRIGYR